MKSILRLCVVAAIVALLFACASMPKAPDWYLNPPVKDGYIYGTGEAKMSSANMSKNMADSRARTDVAQQVEITVKSAVTDYAQEAGEGKNTQAIEFAETVSRQVAEVTLNSAKVIKREVGDDGTYYSLVEYPEENVMKAADEAFKRNEAAAFAEFKASQALDKLNFELKNTP